ncbi:hypothetical protein DDP52_07960 [Helicobacter pylori]|nr:hypothetical protein DDP52_07960 [Helicobacter pylori]
MYFLFLPLLVTTSSTLCCVFNLDFIHLIAVSLTLTSFPKNAPKKELLFILRTPQKKSCFLALSNA